MTSQPPEAGGDRGAAQGFGFDLPPGVAMSATGDYFFRAGQLLVPRADLAREGMRALLDRLGELRERDDRPSLFHIAELEGREPRDLDPRTSFVLGRRTLEVLDEIEGIWPDCGVELNYVFIGAQSVMGGPATLAEPAAPPVPDWDQVQVGEGMGVGILDTGIVGACGDVAAHANLAGRFFVCKGSDDEDRPAVPNGTYLARQGGHGTFVAGLVRKIAPAARIGVRRVLSPSGEGDVEQLLDGIVDLRTKAAEEDVRLDVLNLSLGGYCRRDRPPATLAEALRPLMAGGTVVVAAAGNNASWRPFYPAALPDVVGVGALDGRGPASFTNYGPWVDACAPGVNVVSTFFDESHADVARVQIEPHPWSTTPIPARFPGFARWSGTSFAAPAVAGAIVAAAWAWGVPAAEAARRLVEDWHRYRVPDLGVVVNVC
jgi:subtilisin family serine protease